MYMIKPIIKYPCRQDKSLISLMGDISDQVRYYYKAVFRIQMIAILFIFIGGLMSLEKIILTYTCTSTHSGFLLYTIEENFAVMEDNSSGMDTSLKLRRAYKVLGRFYSAPLKLFGGPNFTTDVSKDCFFSP